MIDAILEKYPNDVKIVIKNFPLDFHKEAKKAAKYALAAHKQGKFKEMYYEIFENYTLLKDNEDLPLEYAKKLKLDINQFMKDFKSKEIINQINLEINQLKTSGISRIGVPKFLINGQVQNEKSLDAFSRIIDKELRN